MDSTRKEIGAHEIDKHQNIVIIRELNGKNTIMPICYFRRKMAPDGRLIKHKSRLCAHGGIQKWGVNYWET